MKSSFLNSMIVLIALLYIGLAGINQINGMTAEAQSQPAEVVGISPGPKPDHLVILILENHEFSQIIGSKMAPYINALVKDTFSVFFKRSYNIEHPSQPNYLDFFSGFNQGVTDDGYPKNAPFTTPNLGSQLLGAGKSFATFSEDLPVVGYHGEIYGAYVRKHNPAANWMGTGKNQIPETTNQPFSAFPADYAKLPTVSLVIPNQNNDMHNGSIPGGDAWVRNHLDGYIQWAKKHNGLFILTFDEDNYGESDHIVTIFTGEMVKGGVNKLTINHFNVLRTIEWMYGLPYLGNAAKVKTIDNCWR